MTNATNGTTGETFALETRAEELTYVSGARRVRRGESDRLEVGSGPAQDAVAGTEHTRIGGQLSEHTGGNLSTQVSRMETTVEGKLTLRLKSDTTLLGGAMTDVHTGGVFIGAGMSDDMIIGGGVRVTAPADLWLCGLIGMEEKLGSAYADGALVELYRLAFEREYATGVHVAGAAVFSGTVHATMATGFRQLFKVSTGVRDLTPGGNAEGGAAPVPPAAPAPRPVAPPPVEEAGASGALLGPSAVGMGEVDELAALEDIRYLFGDLDLPVDSGRPGNRAAVLEDLGSVAKFSATGEDVGNTRALMNHLQEGAGLSDLVDGEDLRAMLLHLDESPETLGDARMVPDERLDRQWPDRHWTERGCIDPVEIEVRFEHLLGPGTLPERMNIRQHRAALGVDDFDMASAVTELSASIDAYAIDSTPGTTVLLEAFDRGNGRALAELENLPEEMLARAKLTDDSGELSPAIRRQIQDDPGRAYRILTEMEADAYDRGLRLSGQQQGAGEEDLAMADYLATVIAGLDHHAKSEFNEADEAAEALRLADNMPLANDVDQPAMVRAIQERLAALEARRATLGPNDAKEIAQLEAERAFLNAALRRVEEGYDPGLRLLEMGLVEQYRVTRQGGDASELENITDAYRNVIKMLDDYPVRVVYLPSIDDVRQSGVGTSSPTWYPGEDLTDDSTLSRYSPIISSVSSFESAGDTGSNVLFTDSQDAAHFDTSSSDLRSSLDIRLEQLDREDSSVFDELYDRYNRKRPLEDTSGSDESDLPPPKRPKRPR